jgi:hypothetical protein
VAAIVQTVDIERLRVDKAVGGKGRRRKVGKVSCRRKHGLVWVHSVTVVVVVIGPDARLVEVSVERNKTTIAVILCV